MLDQPPGEGLRTGGPPERPPALPGVPRRLKRPQQGVQPLAVQYIHLDHEAYKAMEAQMKKFAETTHKTEGGFYHKSIRLKIGGDLIMEFHGPLVGGDSHREGQ